MWPAPGPKGRQRASTVTTDGGQPPVRSTKTLTLSGSDTMVVGDRNGMPTHDGSNTSGNENDHPHHWSGYGATAGIQGCRRCGSGGLDRGSEDVEIGGDPGEQLER